MEIANLPWRVAATNTCTNTSILSLFKNIYLLTPILDSLSTPFNPTLTPLSSCSVALYERQVGPLGESTLYCKLLYCRHEVARLPRSICSNQLWQQRLHPSVQQLRTRVHGGEGGDKLTINVPWMRSSQVWMRSSRVMWMRSSRALWMRSS